jgi:hypothetical protein
MSKKRVFCVDIRRDDRMQKIVRKYADGALEFEVKHGD